MRPRYLSVLLLFMSACAVEAHPTLTLPQQVAPATSEQKPLTAGQLARAIAIRGRIERAGARPIPGTVRTYDVAGRLTAEFARSGSGLIAREPSMPAHLRHRDIRTFLSPSVLPRALSTSVALGVVAVDTVDGVIYTAHDSTWTTTGSGYAIATHDTETTTAALVSDLWWANSGDVGDMTLLGSAVITTCAEGLGCIELMPDESDIAAMVEELAHPTIPYVRGEGLADRIALEAACAGHFAMMAGMMAKCAEQLSATIKSAMITAGYGLGAVITSGNPVAFVAHRMFVRRGIRAGIGTLLNLGTYASCMSTT